jgi:hypothetical protein
VEGAQSLADTNFAINLKHVVGNSIVQLHVITEIEQQALMLKRILGLATARKDYKVRGIGGGASAKRSCPSAAKAGCFARGCWGETPRP